MWTSEPSEQSAIGLLAEAKKYEQWAERMAAYPHISASFRQLAQDALARAQSHLNSISSRPGPGESADPRR